MKIRILMLPLLFLAQTASAAFTDVGTPHPNYDAIMWAQNEGIVKGYSDGTFRPDATVNRAEFLKIIVEAENIKMPLCELGIYFKDMDTSSWYWKYVTISYCNSLVIGYPDGTLRASSPINFVEAAKIIANADAGVAIPEYGDNWYQVYVDYLSTRQAIPSSIQSLDQLITRAEMIEMMYRLLAEEVVGKKFSTIIINFYTQQDLKDLSYEANFSVVRTIPKTATVADAALTALFAGPTAAEYEEGARTYSGLESLSDSYNKVVIYPYLEVPLNQTGEPLTFNDVAVVDFDSTAENILNGPAGIQVQTKAAIEATLKNFPSIDTVLYSIDGTIRLIWDA